MAKWYVIQVRAGQEDAMLEAIAAIPDISDIAEDCFTPRYRTQQKFRGVWHTVERKLIPGYLIAVTDRPDSLSGKLRGIRGFAKLLRNENGFTSLDDDEVAWLNAFTSKRDHVIPLSSAVKEGDTITITDGPLAQHAAKIARIDRHRSVAYVEIRFLGRVKEVPVGLKIVAKRST